MKLKVNKQIAIVELWECGGEWLKSNCENKLKMSNLIY